MEAQKQKADSISAWLLLDLPDEIYVHIFSFLRFEELCSASLVCKDWYGLSSEFVLWRNLLSDCMKRFVSRQTLYLDLKPSAMDWLQNEGGKSLKREGLIRNPKGEVMAGSLDCLVDALIFSDDKAYVDIFLNTFPTFMTPAALFVKLMQRYDAKLLSLADEEDEEDGEREEEEPKQDNRIAQVDDEETDEEERGKEAKGKEKVDEQKKEEEEEEELHEQRKKEEQEEMDELAERRDKLHWQFFSVEQLREEQRERQLQRKLIRQKEYKDKEHEEDEEEDELFWQLWRKKNICCFLDKWCSSFYIDFVNHKHVAPYPQNEKRKEKETNKRRIRKQQEVDDTQKELVLALKIFVRGIAYLDFHETSAEEMRIYRDLRRSKEEMKKQNDKGGNSVAAELLQKCEEHKKKGKKTGKIGALIRRSSGSVIKEMKRIQQPDREKEKAKEKDKENEKEKEKEKEDKAKEEKGTNGSSCGSIREGALQSLRRIVALVRNIEGNTKPQIDDDEEEDLSSEEVVESLMTMIEVEQCPALVLPKKIALNEPGLKWSDIPPIELARQMTLLHYYFLSSINKREFLKRAWRKQPENAPNVCRNIHHFNAIASWVSRSIIEPIKLAERCRVINRLMEIILELEKLGNFNGLAAMMLGYYSSSVQRLKLTFKQCPKKTMQTYKTLGRYFQSSSYVELGEVIQQRKLPLVPFLGLYLSDLNFLEDSQPNITKDGLINFHKRALLSTVIADCERFQRHPFHLKPIPEVIHVLLHLPTFSDEQCWLFSKEREPRETRTSTTRH